jgi:hypothetical protein|tara:strand:- start:789 stop:1814 length:1026 start_codon:yes stop_codon:yes gene_type:complete
MAIDRRRRLDTVNLQERSKYQEQGITRISNNDSVVKRDSAGNIELQENKPNALLIIEPIYKKILNSSVVKVLDTQFNYFKFPVRIAGESLDLNLDLDLDLPESDNISTNLTITVPFDEQNQPQNFQRINGVGPNTWFRNDIEDPGGFRELAFTGGTQPRNNSYTITEPILNSLNERNKTLRFRVQTQYRTGDSSRTEFRLRLNRTNPKIYHPFKIIELVTEQNVQGETENPDNPNGFSNNAYPFFTMTYIVDMEDTQPGDIYTFSTVSSNAASFILAQNCYWDVDVIDIPTTPGIYGASDNNTEELAGVYQFSANTLLRDGEFNTKAKRSLTTNQEIQLFT